MRRNSVPPPRSAGSSSGCHSTSRKSYPMLGFRVAHSSLMVLMAILVISSFMLMPGQSLTALGLEIAAVGVLLFFVGSGMEIYALRKVNLQNRRPLIGNLVLLEIGILPFIFGGVLLLFGIESGFY